MKLTFHKAVQDEVSQACLWYDERRSGLGDGFFQELEKILLSITAAPTTFTPVRFGRRMAHLKRFPYAVFYRVLADRIRILTVRHDKRHPSYGVRRH